MERSWFSERNALKVRIESEVRSMTSFDVVEEKDFCRVAGTGLSTLTILMMVEVEHEVQAPV